MKSQINKPILVWGTVFLFLSLIAVLAVMWIFFAKLSCPKFVDIDIRQTTLEQISANGSACLRVSKPGGSPVGQIQEIAYEIDPNARTIRIFAYQMMWHPFSPVVSHRRWPLIIDLTPVPDGEYKVECLDQGKYQEVARFTKP